MFNSIIRQSFLFILLVFLQVCLFEKIHLFGYGMSLLYIYFIIQLAVNMNRNLVLLLAVLIGLCIDIFSHTLGLHMFSCVIVGFSRVYFLQLFAPNDLFEEYFPSSVSFGKRRFFYYLSSMVILHQVVLFTIESLSLFDSLSLIFRIVGSVVLTVLLIFAVDSFNIVNKKQ